MKAKYLIFALALSVIGGAHAEGWDDLVFTGTLLHNMTAKPVPNVPCQVFFEGVPAGTGYDQWGFSDSTGFVAVKLPRSSSSMGSANVKIKIGYGTKWYTVHQENTGEVVPIDEYIPAPNGTPDTIPMEGLNPWKGINITGVAPDSLVIADTLLDAATGLGIENATALIKYKRYPSEPDWQITRTVSSDEDGLVRYALYNDRYMRVVSVSYTTPGYTSPADHVDSIQAIDAVWDGVNDRIPGKKAELRAQSVGVRDQSAYTRNAPASVKIYSLNGRVVGTTATSTAAFSAGLARSKRTIGAQRVVVK